MTRGLALLAALALALGSACSPSGSSPPAAPPGSSPSSPETKAAAPFMGPLPGEPEWRRLLETNPGQETLDSCIALAGRGASALEKASGRACLANIALLGCPQGEKARCADAALEQLEAALELAPEAGRLHLGRLRVLLDAGRPGELAAALLDSFERRAGELEDVPVWLGYASELVESGELRAAAAYAEALRTQFPDQPQVLATLGACLSDLGRSEQASEVLEHGIELAPDDPSLNWAMGWHHQRSERPVVARAFFEQAIDKAPSNETLEAWSCDYGRLLERTGKPDRARELERACRLQRKHCAAEELSATCSALVWTP